MVAAGVLGAFVLGRGNPRGLALMEATPAGAWRSFLAALICLPAFLALRIFGWGAEVPAGGLARAFTAELIGYVIAWFAFALLSLAMVRVWGKGALWPRFIAAWNWTNIVQYTAILAATLFGATGVPMWLAQGAALAAFGYAVWLEWFVARQALGVTPLQATALVMTDLALGLFIGGFIERLSGG